MLSITPCNLRWLETEIESHDLCCHGGVTISTAGSVLVDQANANWTLSAAALYLLRTLEADHVVEPKVCDHMFPCCGHVFIPVENGGGVVVVGCPNGFDFDVRHCADGVRLRFEGADEVLVPEAEWRSAVIRFADIIERFYASSDEKTPQVDADGYRAFWLEWRDRRARAID